VRRTRFTIALVVVLVAGAAVASAAPERKTLRHSRVFSLAAGKTRTFKVGYPDALKFGGSKYSGAIGFLFPHHTYGIASRAPSKLHVLRKGSCDGGSDFCATVRNSYPSGTRPVLVRVTAITELPPDRRR
jgi:hypothetical protein